MNLRRARRQPEEGATAAEPPPSTGQARRPPVRPHPLADEAGWTPHSFLSQDGLEVFTGFYRARDDGRVRHFQGQVHLRDGANSRAYIKDPPPALRRVRQFACFYPCDSPGWYRLKWARGTGDLDRTIAYIEGLIDAGMHADPPSPAGEYRLALRRCMWR
jgi:hypothetical protein